MDESGSTNFALIESDNVRKLPDSQLAARINELNTGLNDCLVIAISAGSQTVRHAVAMGQVLEEAMRRHSGEFEDWLEAIVARDEHGEPKLSVRTALKYRTLWKKRDLIFPADGSEPKTRNLTEAYIKCGILSEPETGEPAQKTIEPFFRLAFVAPAKPIEQWPPEEVQSFLERTKPIVELYHRAEELRESA